VHVYINSQFRPVMVTSLCTKARKLLGLLYHRFYKHAEPSALLQLYLLLVRPHLEYASDVWDPHLQKDVTLIENVQKFGLRICAKQWDLGYDELISNFDVCTLQTRRLEHKFCTMFKIVHNLISFPPILVPRYSWGEPERAPHRRVCCKFSLSLSLSYICRTSCRKSLPDLILRLSNL